MLNEARSRRHFLLAGCALGAAAILPTSAAAQLELWREGVLRIAVYADFPPHSANGDGVEIALGRALAQRLGLEADIVEFVADEDMGDDLRNMVWRGFYRGTEHIGHAPADVMLHVPVHPHFVARQRRVTIFGPYHLEMMAIARDPERIPPLEGSLASAFEIFETQKIGAEIDTHGSEFLLQVNNGKIRQNVVHFRTMEAAASALQSGEIAAIIGTRTRLEGALRGAEGYRIDALRLPEMRVSAWPVGMAVRAEAEQLAEALAEALAELQRSGEVARIYERYGLTNLVP